jgi:hypothetical protein
LKEVVLMERKELPTPANDGTASSTIAMIERDTDKGSRMGWWYRLAALERSMAEQAQIEADQKHQLEASVQQIIQVHTQVANGNFSARVPVDQGNTLWEQAWIFL